MENETKKSKRSHRSKRYSAAQVHQMLIEQMGHVVLGNYHVYDMIHKAMSNLSDGERKFAMNYVISLVIQKQEELDCIKDNSAGNSMMKKYVDLAVRIREYLNLELGLGTYNDMNAIEE